MSTTPEAALIAQRDLLECMIMNLQEHVENLEALMAKDEVTWTDVSVHAHIVDMAKRSDFI